MDVSPEKLPQSFQKYKTPNNARKSCLEFAKLAGGDRTVAINVPQVCETVPCTPQG
jgi:hypothetical protein